MKSAIESARRTVLDAFLRNPRLEWTTLGLAVWYGIRIDTVRSVVSNLVSAGIVRPGPGPGETYVLSARRKAGPRHVVQGTRRDPPPVKPTATPSRVA